MSDPSSPDHDELIRPRWQIRWRLWLWLGLGLVSVSWLLTWLVPLAVRFPGASLPAILGAAFGYYRARRRGFRVATLAPKEGQLLPMQEYMLVWGIICGAVGCAVLAAARIGIPAPGASLAWRLVGGVVFGAAAGAGAGAVLPLFAIPFELFRLRRGKRAA